MKNGTKVTSTAPSPILTKRPIAGASGLFISPGYGRHPDRVLDSWELIMVKSGTLHIEEDGIEYRIAPGESLLMQAFQRHRGLSEHPEDLSFYWVHFTLDKQRLTPPLSLPRHGRLSRPERLAEWFHQYLSDQNVGLSTQLALDSLLLLMLNETTLPKGTENARSTAALVRKVEEHISHQLRHGITPGELAQVFGYNASHLSRLFRQVHGVTLGKYIHRVQLTQAKTLLQKSTAPLKQIAAQCGFQDAGYFRRLFRRELGISPREYRTRFGKVYINRD